MDLSPDEMNYFSFRLTRTLYGLMRRFNPYSAYLLDANGSYSAFIQFDANKLIIPLLLVLRKEDPFMRML